MRKDCATVSHTRARGDIHERVGRSSSPAHLRSASVGVRAGQDLPRVRGVAPQAGQLRVDQDA